MFFFFNETATTEIYTLSLHDALPIFDLCCGIAGPGRFVTRELGCRYLGIDYSASAIDIARGRARGLDRKSTRLNSSHANISYAVFCLKKKKIHVKDQSINYRYALSHY